jgi:hypothetical protein
MGKNKNSDGDIFGFFGALFGACMPEERRENKGSKENPKKPNQEPDDFGSIVKNLLDAMVPSKNELSDVTNDSRQLVESGLYRNQPSASKLSEGSEYFTGHRPPGFITDMLGFITDPVSPYALPLDDEKRNKTVQNLTEYSQNSPSQTSLSLKAQKIAENLQLRDSDGQYKFQSLAGAAHEAGLSKENLKDLATIAQQDPKNRTANDRNSQGGNFNQLPVNGSNGHSLRQPSFRLPAAEVYRDPVSLPSRRSLSIPSRVGPGGGFRGPRGGESNGGGGSSRW